MDDSRHTTLTLIAATVTEVGLQGPLGGSTGYSVAAVVAPKGPCVPKVYP